MTRGQSLTAIFLVALLLGPGPGATLIDGTPGKPNIWFGVPALYLWVVLWFLVMAGCIVTAALTVWNDRD